MRASTEWLCVYILHMHAHVPVLPGLTRDRRPCLQSNPIVHSEPPPQSPIFWFGLRLSCHHAHTVCLLSASLTKYAAIYNHNMLYAHARRHAWKTVKHTRTYVSSRFVCTVRTDMHAHTHKKHLCILHTSEGALCFAVNSENGYCKERGHKEDVKPLTPIQLSSIGI